MNKTYSAVLFSIFAMGSVCSFAADLSGDERSELRQRAETFQAQRARNPSFEPGEARLPRERGDLRLDRQTSDVKPRHTKMPKGAKGTKGMKAKKTSAKKTSAKITKAKAKQGKSPRSLKNLPGALVR
jgi:hypothetical protein